LGRVRLQLFVLSGLAIAAVPESAAGQQQPPLVSDRPDETESALSVAPGYVQFELGYSYVQLDGRVEQHQAPEALARIGVVAGWEARFGFKGWRSREVLDPAGGTQTITGVGPLAAGVKWQFRSGEGFSPDLALLGELNLPTATEGLGPERVDPSIRLAAGHELSEAIGMSYNLGVRWLSEQSPEAPRLTRTQLLYSLAFGFALAQRAGIFAEAFGTLPLTEEGLSEHLIDGGLTYLLLSNLQLDVKAGIGLVDAADDWLFGAGLVWRVPR
jgi:hypothetical protein